MVYEIVYFNSQGRADYLKLIAEVANIPYKFVGISGKEEWPAHKPQTRYGQLPYLKIDDQEKLYQTIAIARYLAQEGGLYPTDRKEALLTEEFVSALEDIFQGFVRVAFRTPEEKKAEETKTFAEGTLKNIFGALNTFLEKNGGYLTGKLNWADLYFFELAHIVENSLKIDVVSIAPQLPKLREHVLSNERAKNYWESERNLKNKV
ncbi:hypothetical protein C9374_001358 [Naegleria lovaniensis]|uniref:Glutathione S-transferase n=1 Tax=Naegleria lovaniensis TaxID=51637 RepID=A0AA88GX82_NAELO|nr:uncharacterized protein C9374_001358 [Naegleria lovaniensis]KAG2387764.1 hypothetical protein C9374_001358 [Naegleria lovaniensis]